MQYIAYKEVSVDGRHTRHYVISPAGDVVCTTYAEHAAETLARILNTHGGRVHGISVLQWDWAADNDADRAAA